MPRGQIIARSPGTWLVRLYHGRDAAIAHRLRPLELQSLFSDAEGFDSRRETLTITRTLERAHGKWEYAETKRPRSRRTVTMPSEVAVLLRDHIASERLEPKQLLFRHSYSGPLHERNLVQRFFRHLVQLPGVRGIRLCGRHMSATLALRRNVPTHLVSEQLGHASVPFTLEVHVHVLKDSRAEEPDRLSALVFRPSRICKPVERVAAQRKSVRKGGRGRQ
jgi:integrase